jgi:hypothetical protein
MEQGSGGQRCLSAMMRVLCARLAIYLVLCSSLLILSGCGSSSSSAPTSIVPTTPTLDSRDPSVARLWNDVLLHGIRNDFARPTVHSRNLWHVSAAIYDAWAVFDSTANTWLLGNQVDGFACDFVPPSAPIDVHLAREEAISHAAFRLIEHRFAASPGEAEISITATQLLLDLGFDVSNRSLVYGDGSAAALGNYIADCYIQFGLQDGANESNDYENTVYQPVNPAVEPELPGNPNIVNLDRWQPISLTTFIDQAGNRILDEPTFLGPEWGQVSAFALTDASKTTYQRDGFDYDVYYDPGMPPTSQGPLWEEYKWGFSLVSIWSGHLDPTDGVMMDISPASLGNIQAYPADISEYPQFYNTLAGGDASAGYTSNPITGAPYAEQLVPRGDYARVIAEYWADGPESETPPGHWFVILNEVNDHPDLVKRFGGAGSELTPLEWDVKAYFALAGAMHDSAIAAWGIKGWYDYIRPLSSIRAMADLGQSSDPLLASYHVDGIPLVEDYIQLVPAGGSLAGPINENVGKIKLFAWRGPDFIDDPAVDQAGVGWILAENWWPYQRPSFVTPPFAGYISGHSTFSRAGAEVLTALTGSEYFPGGMGGVEISANDFLVFEEGPSVNMTLQWATYRDASDQCSLSRIWGGIHPPADDIPGRLIGEQIGNAAFELANTYYRGTN